jgi:hypothetical protein
MSISKRLVIAVALLGAVVVFPGVAQAQKKGGGGGSTGGSTSCKGDRSLDAPMQFTADVESAGRVHLSASGGADKSGYVEPNISGAWKVYDSSGKQVTLFTSTLFLSASLDMLKETYLEGLLPGSYTVDLTSMDLCGNVGHAQRAFTINQPSSEGNLPVVSTPTLVQVGGLGATAYTLYFTATDDTAIRKVSIYVNGNLIGQYSYFDGKSFRWWTAFYPNDSTLTALEGPSFYVMYPDSYKGQSSFVQVVAEDLAGNQFTSSAQLVLP